MILKNINLLVCNHFLDFLHLGYSLFYLRFEIKLHQWQVRVVLRLILIIIFQIRGQREQRVLLRLIIKVHLWIWTNLRGLFWFFLFSCRKKVKVRRSHTQLPLKVTFVIVILHRAREDLNIFSLITLEIVILDQKVDDWVPIYVRFDKNILQLLFDNGDLLGFIKVLNFLHF